MSTFCTGDVRADYGEGHEETHKSDRGVTLTVTRVVVNPMLLSYGNRYHGDYIRADYGERYEETDKSDRGVTLTIIVLSGFKLL